MIDRIDFSMLADTDGAVSVIVQKLRRAPEQRRDIPVATETKPPDFDLDAAIQWCEENGFTVYWWYDLDGHKCARAFKGDPWPIRRSWEILRLRQKLDEAWASQFRKNPGKSWPVERLLGMDLAYAG